MSKKSLLKSLSKLFIINNKDRYNISAAKAVSIQQEYLANFSNLEPEHSATYITIAKQLDDKRPEIVDAALFYLKKIAQNHPYCSQDIVDILQQYSQRQGLSQEQKEKVQSALAEIQKNA